jgi:hypothetical protein
MATWSAPGEYSPEFLSVAKAMAGAAALPKSKALVMPLIVTLLLGVLTSLTSRIINWSSMASESPMDESWEILVTMSA